MKYRKKPIVIEAIQFTGDKAFHWMIKSWGQLFLDVTNHEKHTYDPLNTPLTIKTLEGEMRVSPGDFVIKGIANEFYPCKPGIFKDTYDKVEDE